jgi:hypothetical protein
VTIFQNKIYKLPPYIVDAEMSPRVNFLVKVYGVFYFAYWGVQMQKNHVASLASLSYIFYDGINMAAIILT